MTGPDLADAVVLEVRIDAPPATVFAYFTDPARLLRWMGVEAELDPRPGGGFRVNVNGRDVAEGAFVEAVPHERVVFTRGWRGGAMGLRLAPARSRWRSPRTAPAPSSACATTAWARPAAPTATAGSTTSPASSRPQPKATPAPTPWQIRAQCRSSAHPGTPARTRRTAPWARSASR